MRLYSNSERWGEGKRPQPKYQRRKGPKTFVDGGRVPLQIQAMTASKDTPKAIAIILLALGVLAGLLVFANHVRPHP
jgi:hypothetical protein